MSIKVRWVTNGELARHLGVSPSQVSAAKRKGIIGHGEGGKYNLHSSVAAFEAWQAQIKKRKPRVPPRPPPELDSEADAQDYIEAQKIRAKVSAEVKQAQATSAALAGHKTGGASDGDWKALRERESYLKMKLERKEKQGLLVRRSAVEEAWSVVATLIREDVQRIPYQVADLVAAEPVPKRCLEILQRACDDALNALADRLVDSVTGDAEDSPDEE